MTAPRVVFLGLVPGASSYGGELRVRFDVGGRIVEAIASRSGTPRFPHTQGEAGASLGAEIDRLVTERASEEIARARAAAIFWEGRR